MQISPITNYNQQINVNNKPNRIKNTPSFGQFNVKFELAEHEAKLDKLFSHPKFAAPFVEDINKFKSTVLNLREMIDPEKLTPTGKNILKEFFNFLGECNVQDYTFNMIYNITVKGHPFISSFQGILPCNEYSGDIIYLKDSIPIRDHYKYRDRDFANLEKKDYPIDDFGSGNIISIYDANGIKNILANKLINRINEVASKYDEYQKQQNIQNNFDNLQQLFDAEPEKLDIKKAIEVPAEDLLSVDSVVCTLDDINNYIMEHLTELGEGRIFNKPVTKDGESLLIALAHVQPDKDNIDAYIRLVKSMIKMPFIDYNQKDTMNVPFIAHVLNSQNKVLFAAVAGCKNLRYEPSLEFEFNSITDTEFKELVLKTPIFENEENSKFKTVFGKPNPVYKEPSLIDVAGIG